MFIFISKNIFVFSLLIVNFILLLIINFYEKRYNIFIRDILLIIFAIVIIIQYFWFLYNI